MLRRPRLARRDDDLAYLLRVLRKTWISCHRAASVRPARDGTAELELFADPVRDPAQRTVELKAIYEAIGALPDQLRETIAAVDIAGLSYKEAARARKRRRARSAPSRARS